MDSIRNECTMNEAGPHVVEEKPLLCLSPAVGSHQILEADETNDPTILEYLNEDCWRVVLDHVPLKDILRSESVSRRWQRVVLTYLQIVKELRIEYDEQLTGQCWINIKSTNLKTVDLKLCQALEPRQLLAAADRFSQLTKLKLVNVPNEVFQQLHMVLDKMPNLETMVLKWCKDLEPCHLLAAADRFSQLKKLELIYVPNEVFHQLHMVLDKMPNLEHLRIDKFDGSCVIIDDVFESICRLQRLKHLSVNQNATDKNVGDVARCCTALRSLELKFSDNLTVDGLTALCRYAGERLTTLAIICCTRVTENDLVNCILSCPNLTTLDVRGTFSKSEFQAIAAAAAAARRDMRARTLLRLDVNNNYKDWNKFDFDISPWIDMNFRERASDEEDYNPDESWESDDFIPEIFG